MKKICYIIAKHSEARPLIEHFNLRHVPDYFSPLPCQLYRGSTGHSELYVVLNGTQHQRDLVGCEAASVTTMAAIEHLHPDIVISSGTCGAWKRYGAKTGQVYLGNGAMFHDRRVPGDNKWGTQGLGNYPVWQGTEALAESLQLPTAKVTTGSSFDMTAEEETIIDQNSGRLKEMEGAAVAFVCSLYNKPVLLVKAVTNLRDAEQEDMTAFQENLHHAATALTKANARIIAALAEHDE